MPRKNRQWYPGAIYHVMSRGNRKTTIFRDDLDYLVFMRIVMRTRKRYSFRVLALCLMTNHFHLLIETEETELWKIMHLILGSYAMAYNQRHDFTGHVFEGRYTACLVRDERYLLEASRYIHLNPVKAKMVTDPLDYIYNSYGLYVGKESVSAGTASKTSCLIANLTDPSRVLGYFPPNEHEQYRKFVESRTSHAEHEAMIQKDIREDEMWLPKG